MANPFFTNTVDLVANTRARAQDVEDNFDAVETGFDLVESAKADRADDTLSNPTFTGTVTAPTAASGDNSTKVATTAYVQNEIGLAPQYAQQASDSAAAAAVSEANASASAFAAASSESNAATSASNANDAIVAFRGSYYGPLASDPALDPNGNAAGEGDLYYNTTLDQMLVYDGAAWVSLSASPGSVTSINVSGGTTGITFSGGPVTTSGTITAAGTLGIGNGGTGQTTASAAINALLPSQGSNAGKLLQTNGSAASWVDTLTGKLTGYTSTTSAASFGIPHGTAPSSPVNGDVWSTTTSLNYYLNGATKSIAFTDSNITGTAGGLSATLAVGSGGTGATTLTGIVKGNGTGAFTAVAAPTGALVGTTDTQTITGKTFGNYTETVYTLGTSGSIALNSVNGPIQSCAASSTVTFTDSLSAGQSIVLHLTNGDAQTINWPTVTWVKVGGSAAPTLTASDVVVLWKVSTTLYAVYAGSAV